MRVVRKAPPAVRAVNQKKRHVRLVRPRYCASRRDVWRAVWPTPAAAVKRPSSPSRDHAAAPPLGRALAAPAVDTEAVATALATRHFAVVDGFLGDEVWAGGVASTQPRKGFLAERRRAAPRESNVVGNGPAARRSRERLPTTPRSKTPFVVPACAVTRRRASPRCSA